MQQSIRDLLLGQATGARGAPKSVHESPAAQMFSRKRKRAQKEEMEPQAAPDEQQQASEVTASRIAPPRLPSGSSDKGKALTQLHLDVGQRDFHTTTCTTCGMVFTPGNADDERLHAAFHGKHARALRYHHAKADKTLMVDGSRGKVILLGTQGGGAKSKRVQDLTRVMEEQMGLVKGWLLAVQCSILVYVSSSRHVLGCTVTQSIHQAHVGMASPAHAGQPASCSSHVQQSTTSEAGTSEAPTAAAVSHLATFTEGEWADSTLHSGQQPAAKGALPGGGLVLAAKSQRVRALCGVRAMWTSAGARRQGIATKLLDCARSRAVPGFVVPRHQLAFTQPTAAGTAFIANYTGSSSFLMY